MKLEILDIDRFIKVNSLLEVTDSIYFERSGMPTERGLFSKTIFGLPGSQERRTKWGWINLNIPYMHPIVYKTALQIDTKFQEILSGMRYVRINKAGELIDDDENGWTGMDELAIHWHKIKWSRPDQSPARSSRSKFLDSLSNKKASVFITKWLVTPAIYRDYDAQVQYSRSNIIAIPVENDLYRKLILNSISRSTGLDYSDNYKRMKVQDTLSELYDTMIGKVVKKHGVMQSKLLGKGVDYGVLGVISGPKISNAQSPVEQEVPFGYIGVPLYLLINLFQPLVIKEISDNLFPFKAGQTKFQILDKRKNKYETIDLPEAIREELDPTLFRKWIIRFMKDKTFRTEPVGVAIDDKEYLIPIFNPILGRQSTMTDLFYIATKNAIKNRHIILTRYPIDNFQNVIYVKPKIMTTEKNIKMRLDEEDDPFYPDITPEDDNIQWVDSIRINNSYTKTLGADYDGDRVKLIGVFSHEANEEARNIIESLMNYSDSEGAACRVIGNEGVLTLYSLTK